jgi:hypothetical protein
MLGERHLGTITAMANLALTWRQQGRLDAAEELEVQVLELRKAVLGEKHPDTITAMANLASTWRQQGRSDGLRASGTDIRAPEDRARRETPRYHQSHGESGIDLAATGGPNKPYKSPGLAYRPGLAF